jgi:hypothetical protein
MRFDIAMDEALRVGVGQPFEGLASNLYSLPYRTRATFLDQARAIGSRSVIHYEIEMALCGAVVS